MGDELAVKQDVVTKLYERIVILVDTTSNTPLLAYYTKGEKEDAELLMAVDRYTKSTRYQKAPEHLKIRNLVNHLRRKRYKPVNFEMREV